MKHHIEEVHGGVTFRCPPLGLRPWWIAWEERLQEIDLALLRYGQARWKPPFHWQLERFLINATLHAHCTSYRRRRK